MTREEQEMWTKLGELHANVDAIVAERNALLAKNEAQARTVEELRKDAERYRYLRAHASNRGNTWEVTVWEGTPYSGQRLWCIGSKLDERIDARLASPTGTILEQAEQGDKTQDK